MAVDFRISNAAALAMCDSLVDLLDVGGGGYIEIYSGAVPTDVDAAHGGTVLAVLPLSATAFGAAADINPGARATANAITSDASANNTGTASFFRAYNAGGTAIIQGTVGTSSADMILNSVAIVAGATVSCSSWTITQRESA